MNIGDTVKRNTNERGYQGEGNIVEIDSVRNRARVQWETNKTWYKLDRLVLIKKGRTHMNFTPIECYAILYPEIVSQYYPHFKPVLTLKDWESRHSAADLTELKNWIMVLASDFKNCHYGQLDLAIAKELWLKDLTPKEKHAAEKVAMQEIN